jgi:4-amino-4-deoxy-L-arabinose transferase-like glycosyltransferase
MAFLRLINFQSHVTFLGDQGRDAIIMKRIITFEHFPAIGAPTSVGQIYLGPFYYYFMAPWLLFFGFNPLGPAFGVFFLNFTLGILAYFLVRKYFGKLTSFFFLFLLTFSASNISLSRFSWNPNLLPIFTFFTLFAFYKLLTLKENNKKQTHVFLYAFLFGTLFSFSFQLHYLAVLLLPTCLLFFLYQLLHQKKIKVLFLRLLVAIFSFTFFSIPLLIFDLRHNFLNTQNFIKMFTEAEALAGNSIIHRLNETVINLFRHTFQITLSGYWGLALFALLIFIFIRFGEKAKNLFYWLNFSNLVFFVLGFSLTNSGRFEHYYTPIYYSFFLNLAFVFAWRYKNCRLCRKIVPILLLLYLLANFHKFKVFLAPGGSQITSAKAVSQSIIDNNTHSPYQIVTIPYTETHGQYRYFLEILGNRPLPEQTLEVPQTLFVLCFQKECDVLNDPQWQIAVFHKKKVAKMWKTKSIKIFKLLHAKE